MGCLLVEGWAAAALLRVPEQELTRSPLNHPPGLHWPVSRPSRASVPCIHSGSTCLLSLLFASRRHPGGVGLFVLAGHAQRLRPVSSLSTQAMTCRQVYRTFLLVPFFVANPVKVPALMLSGVGFSRCAALTIRVPAIRVYGSIVCAAFDVSYLRILPVVMSYEFMRSRGRVKRVSKKTSVHPEAVEGSRCRSWFDKLTTNGFRRLIRHPPRRGGNLVGLPG